jgi:hypothetical protein
LLVPVLRIWLPPTIGLFVFSAYYRYRACAVRPVDCRAEVVIAPE